MVHLPELIRDLGLILMAAGIVTLLFRHLRQPVVLGYIISGFLIGPNVPLLPTVVDVKGVQIWAEIGVIFLLFALGLEFSFKKLAKVGGSASITATVEVLGMTFLGYLCGRAFGWSSLDSLFLGGVLAISSTTIIIRAFDELGVKSRGFASLVFGILIVEDLFAILLLVLLSTVAVKNHFSGLELVTSSFRLVFFVVLFFLAGIFLLPSFFRKVRKHLNDETLLVFSLGLCFLMVVMNTHAGFSPALGAFIMGSVLAETTEANRIEHLLKPVKDLFGAVFFVSVGMLIEPKALVQHALPIALLTLVTIFGKFFTTIVGALLSGRSLRHSMQAGMSLAQIGEFSFIIASLGLTLKVTSDFLYPVAVGVSVITTFATPYLIRSSDSLYSAARNLIPEKILRGLEGYSTSSQHMSGDKEWRKALGAFGARLLANSVLISAVFFSVSRFLPELLSTYISNQDVVRWACLATASICSAPFFWALLLTRPIQQNFTKIWKSKEIHRAVLGLELGRLGFSLLLFGILASQFIDPIEAAAVTIALSLLFLFALSRHLNRAYSWLERRVRENLGENGEEKALPDLAPWDAHITIQVVHSDSELVGRSLEELRVRERFGVSIASISRGRRTIAAPGRQAVIFPGDKLAIIGTDEQIDRFSNLLLPSEREDLKEEAPPYVLQQIAIRNDMPFVNKTIRESGLREQTDGLVVGVERMGERILNPDSSLLLRTGDLLWIVGSKEKLSSL